ncbi:MAG TPA: ABC transporter ATP-binding protein, partial [Planctomycetaceae bacterium]|nr:ABC transporter ATP-binding protein [Planctomycetaceae bacterium]
MNSPNSNQPASPQHAQDGRIVSQVACDSVISIRGVSKRFGRKLALDSVDLEIRPGLVFALLGENGAGKSTLIRGLLGFHRFDAGSVSVLGIDPSKNPLELRRVVGYVSDAPWMYEWMTVAEAGWFAAGYYPQGFIARFEQLTGEFELPLHSKIRELSKGMRAKLALSLALAHNPEL